MSRNGVAAPVDPDWPAAEFGAPRWRLGGLRFDRIGPRGGISPALSRRVAGTDAGLPEGGRGPRWSRDGRELFDISESGHLTSVPVTLSARLAPAEPRPLFSVGDFLVDPEETTCEPEPGGRSFIMIREAESKPQSPLVLVLNWFEELKLKVGAERCAVVSTRGVSPGEMSCRNHFGSC